MPSGRQAPRPAASSLTLNRISVYLRCLRLLRDEGMERISSKDLGRRFDLSAAQIRKDLAQFGEFGVRGVGYQVDTLIARLESLLDLDREHRVVVIGLGNLGRALVRFLGSYRSPFRVAALLDHDPEKVGTKLYGLEIGHISKLPRGVAKTGVRMAVLAVPADQAQAVYDRLVAAGLRAVLNFAPVRLRQDPGLPVRSVDLTIPLEELAYLLKRTEDELAPPSLR